MSRLRAGPILAQFKHVERFVDRLLPYFSIALNALLAWHISQSGNAVAPIVYGTKYAFLILRSLDIAFL